VREARERVSKCQCWSGNGSFYARKESYHLDLHFLSSFFLIYLLLSCFFVLIF